jgi:carbon-monoxide dehydrogenase medium subunit
VCPVLAETANQIGDVQVRNRGTIGGSLAHADPAADYPTLLKALGGSITATGAGGERQIEADDLFVGVFTTALEPGELLTSVSVPATTTGGTGAAYVKHRHPASFYAVVGVAAVVAVEGGTCKEARVTVGGAATSPVNATAAAEALVGGDASAEAIAAAAAKVPEAISSPTGDAYASAEYRTQLAGVLAGRALTQAFERAGSG